MHFGLLGVIFAVSAPIIERSGGNPMMFAVMAWTVGLFLIGWSYAVAKSVSGTASPRIAR